MITVQTTVRAPIELVWECFTTSDHIKKWNAASDDWHTTNAIVDLRAGGAFRYRMEAKDGSVGFDFSGVWVTVEPTNSLEQRLDDGRIVRVSFQVTDEGVSVTEEFDAEDENSEDLQRAGWQMILESFKRYVETKV